MSTICCDSVVQVPVLRLVITSYWYAQLLGYESLFSLSLGPFRNDGVQILQIRNNCSFLLNSTSDTLQFSNRDNINLPRRDEALDASQGAGSELSPRSHCSIVGRTLLCFRTYEACPAGLLSQVGVPRCGILKYVVC